LLGCDPLWSALAVILGGVEPAPESLPLDLQAMSGPHFAQKPKRKFGVAGQGWTTGDTGNLGRFYTFKGAENSSQQSISRSKKWSMK
jgi:hypothetical protein